MEEFTGLPPQLRQPGEDLLTADVGRIRLCPSHSFRQGLGRRNVPGYLRRSGMWGKNSLIMNGGFQSHPCSGGWGEVEGEHIYTVTGKDCYGNQVYISQARYIV